MRCTPPLKGLKSIASTIPIDDIRSPTCRFMTGAISNDLGLGYFEKHLWLENTKNVKIQESGRIQEIQRKITLLREGNDLLISYIRQLFDLSQSPTKADLDYLNHLFRVDEEHLHELSKSLTRGKLLIEQRRPHLGEARPPPPWDFCKGNCNCNVCGCGDGGTIPEKKPKDNEWIDLEYVIINGEGSRDQKGDKSNNLDDVKKNNIAPLMDFESRDLFEMERDLEKMHERMITFKRTHPDSDSGESASGISTWSLLQPDIEKDAEETNEFGNYQKKKHTKNSMKSGGCSIV